MQTDAAAVTPGTNTSQSTDATKPTDAQSTEPYNHSCLLPAAAGAAMGALPGFLFNYSHDALGGALRWSAGLAACATTRCLLIKHRTPNTLDAPGRPPWSGLGYDKAAGFGVGAAVVPVAGVVVDGLRYWPMPPLERVLRRSVSYGLVGALVGGLLVSGQHRHCDVVVELCCCGVASAHLRMSVLA